MKMVYGVAWLELVPDTAASRVPVNGTSCALVGRNFDVCLDLQLVSQDEMYSSHLFSQTSSSYSL